MNSIEPHLSKQALVCILRALSFELRLSRRHSVEWCELNADLDKVQHALQPFLRPKLRRLQIPQSRQNQAPQGCLFPPRAYPSSRDVRRSAGKKRDSHHFGRHK
jgi:hypothetical protein